MIVNLCYLGSYSTSINELEIDFLPKIGEQLIIKNNLKDKTEFEVFQITSIEHWYIDGKLSKIEINLNDEN